MLTIRYSPGRLCKFATSMRGASTNLSDDPAGYQYLHKYCNPYLDISEQGFMYFPVGYSSLVYLHSLGFPSLKDVKVSKKPYTLFYKDSQDFDSRTYGSAYDDIILLAHSLNGQSSPDPGRRFSFARHYSLVGDVTDSFSDLPHFTDSFYIDSVGGTVQSRNNYYTWVGGVNVYNGEISSLAYYYGSYYADATPILDLMSSGILQKTYWTPYSVIDTSLDMSWSCTNSLLRIHLEFRWLLHFGDGTTNTHYSKCDIDYPLLFGQANPYNSTSFHYCNMSDIPVRYTWYDSYADGNPATGPVGSVDGSFSVCVPLGSEDSSTESEIEVHAQAAYTAIDSSYICQNFYTCINDPTNDFRATSFFSSAKAVDDIVDRFSDSLTSVGEFVRRIGFSTVFPPELADKASKLDIFEFVDFLSAQISLGNLREFSTLLSQVKDVLSLAQCVSGSSQIYTGHGSFSFTFYSEFNREETRLTTHSTIVLKVSPMDLLSALVARDVLDDLFMSLKRLSGVPLASIISKLVGVSRSIHAISDMSFMTYPAIYVHTYTFLSDLSESELATWNVVAADGVQPALKVYVRDVSLLPPHPMPCVHSYAEQDLSSLDLITLLMRSFSSSILGS